MNTQYDPIAELKARLNEAIAAKNLAYSERDQCVALIAKMAVALGYTVGLGKHDPEDYNWEDDWRNIIFIDLPSGQVSWHIHDSELPLFEGLPTYQKQWDGHTTEQKYDRVRNPKIEIVHEEDLQELARRAYNAYSGFADMYPGFQGPEFPWHWDVIDESIKKAWVEAAQQVIRASME